MPNKKPEQAIVDKCKARLNVWLMKGVVIHYDDLSNSGRRATPFGFVMNTKKGRPDLYVYLRHNDMLWVLFFEVKNPKSYSWSQDQKKFCDKFMGLSNCMYILTLYPEQIDQTIDGITGYSQKTLDGINIG